MQPNRFAGAAGGHTYAALEAEILRARSKVRAALAQPARSLCKKLSHNDYWVGQTRLIRSPQTLRLDSSRAYTTFREFLRSEGSASDFRSMAAGGRSVQVCTSRLPRASAGLARMKMQRRGTVAGEGSRHCRPTLWTTTGVARSSGAREEGVRYCD